MMIPVKYPFLSSSRGRCASRGVRSPIAVVGAALVASTVLLQPAPILAATITVEPGCNLAAAILAANSDSSVGTCVPGSGADRIVLQADEVLSFLSNTTDGDNGLPSVTSRITIEGNGFTIRRSNSVSVPLFRIFHIAASGELTLSNVTVALGFGNEGASHVHRGGGIFNRGVLALDGVVLSGHRLAPSAGSAALTNTAQGGAIYNAGHLSIHGSELIANTAFGFGNDVPGAEGHGLAEGGAIYNASGGSLTIGDSLLDSNTARSSGLLATALGGAVYSETSAGIFMSQVTFVANLAASESDAGYAESRGGALVVAAGGGGLTIADSTFLSNNADASSNSEGGAIAFDSSAAAAISNSTFSANRASGESSAVGGAIFQEAGTATVSQATFAFNSATAPSLSGNGGTLAVYSPASMTVSNSIVSDSAPAPPSDCIGSIVDGGGNFGCIPGAPAVTGLSALADNGGPTQTHALSVGSNAVNAGGACPWTRDQRGISRIGACDVGAFELNPCLSDDSSEPLGSGSTDDTCFGPEIPIGAPQTRLHCDEDWVFFVPDIGKTYEVKTQSLVNGADTVIELSKGCGSVDLGANDDDGANGASRIVFTADAGVFHDVRITEKHDSYNPGAAPPSTVEGYEILARCIGGCACAPPEGPNLDLFDDTVASTVTYETCSVLTVGDWSVDSSGWVRLRAGEAVVLENGVIVEGLLEVEIDSSLLPPP